MKSIRFSLDAILEEAFVKAGFGAGFGHVNLSSRPDLCEYQCNSCLSLAKIVHKKPIDIACEVVDIILAEENLSGAFSKITAYPPGFINMDLSPDFLAKKLKDMALSSKMGLEMDEPPKKIIVDYGGANVAKPLHVGHLRSAVIGEAIKRLGTAFGNEMTGDVHLGDWGTQMGLIYTELKDRGIKDFTLKDLEEIYPAASRRAKEAGVDGHLSPDAENFKRRALLATHALQRGDEEAKAVWKKIMALSLPDLKKNYDSLDVHFELWKGESDVQKYIPDMLESFVKKGIAYESDGALVVDIREEDDSKELPPCIVRKSDGSSLYATTDLATLVEREKLLRPDAYIYVADQRQKLHYLSFFRVAKKAGIVSPDKSLRFLGFGTVNGRDGKALRTREGGVMRLETLVNDINQAAYEKVRASRKKEEISDEEAWEIARMVGLAALKYGDLSNQASKDYIFDPDRFTSFDGNTGPYILYTIVRIGSILKKAALEDADEDPASGDFKIALPALSQAIRSIPTLKTLTLILLRYPDTALLSWHELAPHKLCQFIYELCNATNTFYHEVMVLTEEDPARKQAYLEILSLTRKVLLNSIHMLGFSAPDRM